MPANLTQQYRKAEEAYRRASTPEEELQCLQVMLRGLPKDKAKDKVQSDRKQRISRAKEETEGRSKSGTKGRSLKIPRQGAGRAILIGGPNAGKSQLLCTLTRATPTVAEYPFTTSEASPGMMPWEDVTIQLIDTPPITPDYLDTALQGLIRGADLTLLIVDLASDDGVEHCQAVWDRLNQTKTRLAPESYLDENDIGLSFTKSYLVPNKIDAEDAETRLDLMRELLDIDLPEFVVSAEQGNGIEPLRKAIYEAMDVVRVYTKMPNQKEPDFDRPYTIRRGGTLGEIASVIHKDFATQLKFARVWGSDVHDGTSVKGDYVLHDKDIIELHI